MKKLFSYLFLVGLFCNALFSQTNVSGNINSNTIWSLANSPYNLTANTGVLSGVSLTIEPGVVVTGNFDIQILGSVIANGTSVEKINFQGPRLLFKRTNLLNSQLSYINFNKSGVQLADESEHNEDSNKNFNTLTLQNCDFTNNSFAKTKGYQTTASLVINNSKFSNSEIKGYYPRSETMTFNNCELDNGLIDSDAYNLGIFFNNSLIKSSNITMGCCGANLNFQNSTIYNSSIKEGMGKPVQGVFKLINSYFINSSVNLPNAQCNIDKSILCATNAQLFIIGNGMIKNSNFYSEPSSKNIEITGYDGYYIGGVNQISNSTFSNSSNSILIGKTSPNLNISNCNFLNTENYFIRNNSNVDFNGINNYFNTSTISDKIYDGNDDINSGIVNYIPFLTTPNTSAPIAPPIKVVKKQIGNDLVLTWLANNETDIAGYKIYYGSPTGYSYTSSIDAANVTTYTIVGGNINEEYAITAYDSSKDGIDDQVDGNESWYSIAEKLPELPTNIAIDSAPRKNKISWTLSTSPDVSAYKIYRGITTNPTAEIASVSNTTLTYIDSGLTNETPYFYRIKAVKANGLESEYSSEVSGTPTPVWNIAKTGISNGFGSQKDPLLTIQSGIDSSIAGEIILVQPGTYTENISLNKAVNISSTDGYATTILKSNGLSSTIFTISGLDTNNPINVNLTGFKFICTTANDQLAVNVNSGAFASIQKCWFEGIKRGISSNYGYYDIINSVFKNVEAVSVNETGYTEDIRQPKIINCTVYNSNSITNSQSTIYTKILNSIIVNSINPPISYFNGALPSLTNVILDSNPTAQQGSVYTQISNINEIYFTNASISDFTLKPYSPAIGYGTALNTVTEDALGISRPSPALTSPDAGAFENGLGNPANAQPKINALQDITVLEDTLEQTVSLAGIDDGNLFGAQQNITVSVSSNNATLFTNLSIVYANNSATGNLLFTPSANANGEAIITVSVQDNGGTANGGLDTKIITFKVTVTAVNDAPIANNDAISVSEGLTISTLVSGKTSVLFNDADTENSTLTASVITAPSHGILNLNSNGTFSYTHDGSETTIDSFTYKIYDGGLYSTPSTVSITIIPRNDAPIANNDAISVSEGSTATKLVSNQTSVVFNDTDAENSTLTSSILTSPLHGALALNTDGTFLYTHDGSEATTDSFTYKVYDGELYSTPSTVSITIIPVNDNTPSDVLLSKNSINENLNNQIIGLLSAVDLDSDDIFTYQLISGEGDTDNANFTIVNGNQLKNILSFDYEYQASHSIRVKVTDENGKSFEKNFAIAVINQNDIAITYDITNSYCSGDLGAGSITIKTVTNISGTIKYLWTATNGGVIPSGQQNKQNITNLTAGTYNLTVSDDFYSFSKNFDLILIEQYQDLSICYVSSDNVNVIKNRIFINDQGNYNVAFYEILKESNVANVYKSIGIINSSDKSYLDVDSNNTSEAYKYKVRSIDNCGYTSSNSTLHKTILLQSSIAINGSVNLSWSHYEGKAYGTYNIYRKTNQGVFELIGSIASTNNTYNDQTANNLANRYEYYITIEVSSCNTSISGRSMNSVTEIKSNRQVIGTSLSIEDHLLNSSVVLYPNPATSKVLIELSNDLELDKIELYNYLGQQVGIFKDSVFSIDNLPSGTYLTKVFTGNGVVIKKFIKQ
jgi:VCBS repeat-containing protein